MPKRTDIQSIAIIGAGPIVIGQACEFDYSGVQACKALKEEGYGIVLINSNPATIMTDPNLADATYIEPITPETVAQILERERPQALLATMGGQTALNTAMALVENGTLERLGIELIGANAHSIAMAEDRKLFREAMDRIGLESPKSVVVQSFDEGLAAQGVIGLPAIIRPSFTLGGTGGGIAYNRPQFEELIKSGLAASPVHEILVEESVLGWKEYEMEVVRDKADNCIIICSIENIDPMGVHTGDSITVAPALTLTDKEYQIMRDASIAVLREIGVDTGGSNVQFAVNPDTGKLVVIEMNPRVSRSSALASKATGFPIAKIAAKLAVGYTLDELPNDITGGSTPAAFEPSIDYIVVKIPRFAFEKFPGASPVLTTAMKSVGEVMAIGRSFAESMQKALRSLETGLTGFDEIDIGEDRDTIEGALSSPTPDRILKVAQAFRQGFSVEDIHDLCKYDRWFLRQIEDIVTAEKTLTPMGEGGTRRLCPPPDGGGRGPFRQEWEGEGNITDGKSPLTRRPAGATLSHQGEGFDWKRLKGMGFSDARLAKLLGQTTAQITAARHAAGVRPVFKRIDTCAAEFASDTPYMYSTYHGVENECEPTNRRKIVILGGGPNRIGQGIEFDYCCVHAAYALREAGFETIMVNCNPETVSTDYDTSDRLYFEPLTDEDVSELLHAEMQNGTLEGVIVQLGGQTPLKLAHSLEAQGIRILGTSPDAIDLAEDRERFQQLLHRLNLKQPPNGLARSKEEALRVVETVGFPVVIRPSYVLGGRGMEIVHDVPGLERYIDNAVRISGDNPVLIDSYLSNAIEVDVDVLADGTDVYIAGIMEHIEEAGIHSGDSACALPPYSLAPHIVAELGVQAEAMARALGIVGLMNVQFAIKGDDIYVLEVNPRASRTVPFVAKATGVPIAKIAARVMAGEKLAAFSLSGMPKDHTAVKASVFPFARFPGVDVVLGPEMRSTGEVMGLDRDFAAAFAKAQAGAGVHLPTGGQVFLSVKDSDKEAVIPVARSLLGMGFSLVATGGTAAYLRDCGLNVARINKVLQGSPHIVDAMINGEIQFVINTTAGMRSIADSQSLRRTALMHNIPSYTTVAGARAAVSAIEALRKGKLEVAPLQAYLHGVY